MPPTTATTALSWWETAGECVKAQEHGVARHPLASVSCGRDSEWEGTSTPDMGIKRPILILVKHLQLKKPLLFNFYVCVVWGS